MQRPANVLAPYQHRRPAHWDMIGCLWRRRCLATVRRSLPSPFLLWPLPSAPTGSRAAIGGRVRGGRGSLLFGAPEPRGDRTERESLFLLLRELGQTLLLLLTDRRRLKSKQSQYRQTVLRCVWFLLLPAPAEPVCVWKRRWGRPPERSFPTPSAHRPRRSERWLPEEERRWNKGLYLKPVGQNLQIDFLTSEMFRWISIVCVKSGHG